MSHKFVVIDSDIVGFGSMNFTKGEAKQNAENFTFRPWPEFAKTYASELQRVAREFRTDWPGMVFGQPETSEKTE